MYLRKTRGKTKNHAVKTKFGLLVTIVIIYCQGFLKCILTKWFVFYLPFLKIITLNHISWVLLGISHLLSVVGLSPKKKTYL